MTGCILGSLRAKTCFFSSDRTLDLAIHEAPREFASDELVLSIQIWMAAKLMAMALLSLLLRKPNNFLIF